MSVLIPGIEYIDKYPRHADAYEAQISSYMPVLPTAEKVERIVERIKNHLKNDLNWDTCTICRIEPAFTTTVSVAPHNPFLCDKCSNSGRNCGRV